nr:hypothetical protein [Methylomarinum sp. Ch1-1]MDP4522862.1 hypothetical protein [Methylomarinum sp. Ch1-1]
MVFKPIIHYVFSYDWIEPTGGFDFSLTDWSRYWLYSSMIIAGLLLGRLFGIPFKGNKDNKFIITRLMPIHVWVVLVFFLSIPYVLNFKFNFFVTGVPSKIDLPFYLNAHIAYLIKFGIPLILVALFSYDVLSRRMVRTNLLILIFFFSLLASVSTASRIFVVLVWLPILVSIFYLHKSHFLKINLNIFYFSFFGLVLSLIFVSLYRIELYSINASTISGVYIGYFRESLSLFINRWIGAEALMVSIGESLASIDIFLSCYWRMQA